LASPANFQDLPFGITSRAAAFRLDRRQHVAVRQLLQAAQLLVEGLFGRGSDTVDTTRPGETSTPAGPCLADERIPVGSRSKPSTWGTALT